MGWLTENNTHILGMSDYKDKTTLAFTIDIVTPNITKINEFISTKLTDIYLSFHLQEMINTLIIEQLKYEDTQIHVIRVKEPMFQTDDVPDLIERTYSIPKTPGNGYYLNLGHWIELIQFFVVVTTTVLFFVVIILVGCYFLTRRRGRKNKVIDASSSNPN